MYINAGLDIEPNDPKLYPKLKIQLRYVLTKYDTLIKQEGHDGPEVAHLYIGPPHPGPIFTQGLLFVYLNRLGRHP
jgi:hypothetical protein